MTEPSPRLVHQTAGPLRRLVAAIIDALVLVFLDYIVMIFIPGSSALADDDSSFANPWGGDPTVWVLNVAGILLGTLYFGLAHARWGQTIGKLALKIKVVSVSTGRAPATGQAVLRGLLFLGAPLVPLIGWLLTLADLAWMGLDGRRRCLHDKLVRTVVIAKP
ncbi:RDD family protein [Streptosporangium sandarakinum]|uniref:RDD family protein n=1 Tax=Streptosporangium sandarakinum TaxID=1260955 RepID=UPI00341F53B1